MDAILQRYHHALTQASIRAYPMPLSPPPPIACSDSLRWRLWDNVFPRIRRSLRAEFSYLAEAGPGSTDGISPVIFDDGGTTRDIDGYRPVIAYYEATLIFGTGPNCAPGDVQVPWEWNTGFATHPDPDMCDKYRQVLSNFNWYMKQHRSKYGCILFNHELVVLRRKDDRGNLEISVPIPFTIGGTEKPEMTVLLALLYLEMLAA